MRTTKRWTFSSCPLHPRARSAQLLMGGHPRRMPLGSMLPFASGSSRTRRASRQPAGPWPTTAGCCVRTSRPETRGSSVQAGFGWRPFRRAKTPRRGLRRPCTTAVASRFFQYTLPVDGHLVDLHLPCGATGLAGYEVADLVNALREVTGASIATVAVSPCGRTWYALEPADALLTAGREPREYFGLDFPEVRDQHRSARPKTEAAP